MTLEDLEVEFIRLTQDGELDKIRAMLCRQYPKMPREVVRESLQDACVEVIQRVRDGNKVSNLAGLLSTIGRRRMADAWREYESSRGATEILAHRHEAGEWWHDEDWQERVENAARYVRRVVQDWPADNLRRTLITILEAAQEGVQLRPKDLDELLGCARGTARVWRDRAFDRLRTQVEKDGMSWDEITAAVPDDTAEPHEEDKQYNDVEEETP